MKVIYIDTETTGLDWSKHQVIQIAMVAQDLAKPTPWEELPKFNEHIRHETLIGDPIALAMHAGKIKDIEVGNVPRIRQHEASERMWEWLFLYAKYSAPSKHNEPIGFNAVGKNAAGFDFNFIEKLDPSHINRRGASVLLRSAKMGMPAVALNSRVIDPGSIMTDFTNDAIAPGLDECLKRLGIEHHSVHDALEDCYLLYRIVNKLTELQRETR